MISSTMAGSPSSSHAFTTMEQPRSYPYAPVQAPVPKQKNYVFVDEHNRHKRLKVMRACEGCRRRKIKCESATTNTWPCAACVRLKLQCVPPSISYERNSEEPGDAAYDLHKSNSYPDLSSKGMSTYQQTSQTQQYNVANLVMPATTDNLTYDYTTPVLSFEQYEGSNLPVKQAQPQSATSERSYTASDSTTTNLVDAFGSLKITLEATAPYITDLKQLPESELQEQEVELPDLRGPDNKIRVPPEMMPSEHRALQYFQYYFANVHPFVPVIDPPTFYQAWSSNKDGISPLLLEAIFACVTALMGHNEACAKWLALASRHEEHFGDIPRMSTVQAQILLLKAKEAQPNKRGYFYRSWVSLVSTVGMARDLGLGDHLAEHRDGKGCGSSPAECLNKTRIWQWLFIMETMIGGSQKRLDFITHRDNVDFSEPLPSADASEYRISRQFRQFLLAVRNIRGTVRGYVRHHHKGGDWTFHEDYTSVEAGFHTWLTEIPDDLRIDIPKDDSLPWIPSPFIGFMNTYFHLSKIMHHRPQIHYLLELPDSDAWRPYLISCLTAAKNISRILDSMFKTYGTEGLRAMIRGISFAIYVMLTCAMLHLAAITAPDATINNEARDYFVRSMRLLEHFSPLFPLPSVRRQIDALREAFSADISKPFTLRPGFPFSSPTPPPRDAFTANVLSHSGRTTLQVQTNPMLSTSSNSPASSSQTPIEAQWNPTNLFNKWNSAFYTATADPVGETPSPVLGHQSVLHTSSTNSNAEASPFQGQLLSTGAYTTSSFPLGLQLQTPTQTTIPTTAQPPQHQRQPTRPSQQGAHSVTAPHQHNAHRQQHSQHQQLHQQPTQPQQQSTPVSTQATMPYQVEYMTAAAWQDAVANSFVTGMKRRHYD